MTAPRITAKRIAELKRHYPRGAYSPNREHHPFGHIAYSTIDIHELIDALESAYAELDRLSAQGGEVPEIGDKVRATMNRTDWFEGVFKERSDVFAEFGVEVPGLGLRFFIHAEKIPTPPHPDTVEVSREEWTIAQILANAWSLHPLKCSERDKLVSEWYAMRSSAQPATEREGGDV